MTEEFFRIKINNVKKTAGDYTDLYQKLEQYNETLQDIRNNLRSNVYGNIPGDLNDIIRNNESYDKDLKQLETVLLAIVQKYSEAENRILGVDTEKAEDQKVIDESMGLLSPNSENGEFSKEIEDLLNYLSVAMEQYRWGIFAKETNYLGDFLLILSQNPAALNMLLMDAWNDDSGTGFSKTLRQVLFGEFVEDSTIVGTVLSIAVGLLPVVGQIADMRDLAVAIRNVTDGDPTTSDWVAFTFTAIAFIPAIGDFLKHADELDPILKYGDNIIHGFRNTVKGVMKKGDDVFSAVSKYVDEFNDYLKNSKVVKTIGDKADDVLDKFPKIKHGKEAVDNFLKKEIKGIDTTIGEAVKDFVDGVSGWEDTLQDGIAGAIDYFKGGKEKEIGNAAIAHNGFACAI